MILESQVRALDTAVQALDKQITASTAPRVNDAFKEAWRGYTSRWQIQRDEWLFAPSVTRKFGFNEDRYNDFKTALGKWLADYQKRIVGAAAAPPAVKPPEPSKPLFGNLFAGSGTAIVITALVIGGFLFINKRRSSNGN